MFLLWWKLLGFIFLTIIYKMHEFQLYLQYYITLFKKHWVKDKIKEEMKKYIETNKNGTEHTKTYGMKQKRYYKRYS